MVFKKTVNYKNKKIQHQKSISEFISNNLCLNYILKICFNLTKC